jgi:AmmeMemoRadiSam system protein B
MSDQTVLLPQAIAPLLLLLNGDRTIPELRAAFALRSTLTLTDQQLHGIIAQLDQALMIENGAYVQASQRALDSYRAAPHREPSHAGLVYPEHPDELAEAIAGYCDSAGRPVEKSIDGSLVGMVCPHIDYTRGYRTYASLWQAAAPDLRSIELVVVFGTDHIGGEEEITLTRQPYATPYGTLPTDTQIVEQLAAELGTESAFAREINHATEHSIELAAVWLHHFTRDRAIPMVPILCGPLDLSGVESAVSEPSGAIDGVLHVLEQLGSQRNTLIIAAADMAHIGPAFGDPRPLDAVDRARLTAEDQRSIDAILSADPAGFRDVSRKEDDSRRLCGLPPIYLMLRLLQGARGQSFGYDQCPADDQNGSVVSIVGALLYR